MTLNDRRGASDGKAGRSLLISLLMEEKWLFALTVGISFLGALFEGFGLGLLVPFLDGLANQGQAQFRTGIDWFDRALLAVDADPVERLYRVSGLILGSILVRMALTYVSASTSMSLRERLVHRLRCRITYQLQTVALGYFSKHRAGEFVNVLTQQMGRVRHLIESAANVVTTSFILVIYVVAMFVLSWQMAVIALGFCLLLFLMLGGALRRLRQHGQAIYESDGAVVSLITEMLSAIRTITAFGTREFESRRFEAISAENAATTASVYRRSALVGPVSQGVASAGLIVMLLIAVHFFVMPGRMSVAVLLTFFFALFRLLPLVQVLNGHRSQWAISRNALDVVAQLLDKRDKPYIVDGHRPLEVFRDSIVFENVGFSYEPGQPVLHDISLTIRQGQTTALVGGSGAGKSTLADLLARLQDPSEGRILLDGVDMREFTLESLRRHLVIVSQSTFLFHDTVRANIAYGLDDVPMDRIRWAAEKANALEFIDAMPDGFETVLGDRGERLSGGQRQRISIARALLRDPEILILDEATSALDSVSERLVQESLEYLMEGRTVLVIAHRLSTVESADRVVVLEGGRIVEEGSYDDLLAQKGHLWEYHRLQFETT
jgi:subfamily B ATP-binding cassette protein MsbA